MRRARVTWWGWGLLGAVFLAGPAPARGGPARFDIVIAGARVIDPETGLDGVRDVAVNGGQVAAIATRPLKGRVTVRAHGLILGPGLIDLHSHGMNVPSNWLQAFDGVTTALELEGGAWPVPAAYEAATKEGRPLNFGFAAGWELVRRASFGRRGEGVLAPAESARVLAAVAQALDEGALGIALTPGYIPASNRSEYLALARLAATRHVPTFTHVRFKNLIDPGTAVEGVGEVIAAAAATGAHMHICHINSSATRALPLILQMIEGARARGVPISTEAYPWGAGSTGIGAPFLAPENLPRLGLTPHAIEFLPTGERVASVERLVALRAGAPDGRALIHYLEEDRPEDRALIEMAQLAPGSMIASDTVPYVRDGRDFTAAVWPLPADLAGHPRSAATFLTVLRAEVLDGHRMSMLDFFRRGSLQPAELLRRVAPDMARRGRIRVGAIADLVVLDPAAVRPRATYRQPALPSEGVRALLVGGSFVIRDGALLVNARPGRAIRAARSLSRP